MDNKTNEMVDVYFTSGDQAKFPIDRVVFRTRGGNQFCLSDLTTAGKNFHACGEIVANGNVLINWENVSWICQHIDNP